MCSRTTPTQLISVAKLVYLVLKQCSEVGTRSCGDILHCFTFLPHGHRLFCSDQTISVHKTEISLSVVRQRALHNVLHFVLNGNICNNSN